MNCDKCGKRSFVLETRTDRSEHAINEYGTVYRRRVCKECDITWTTTEIKNDDLDDHFNETRARKAEATIAKTRRMLESLISELKS